jgi:predicted nucleic acid-binding protein
MTSPKDHLIALALCVADANILFDLRNGCIVEQIPSLPYHFIIPDAVFAELEPSLRHTIESLGFEIGALAAPTVAEVYALRAQQPRLSVADLFALFLARDRGALLLTGDKRLRRLAETYGLVVHGVLWILDELYDRHLFNGQQAWAALERIRALGGRLPEAQCQKRRRQWLKG